MNILFFKHGLSSNLFRKAHSHISANETTAFLFIHTPHLPNISFENASVLFMLPNLQPALCDLFSGQRYATCYGKYYLGFALDCALPFIHSGIISDYSSALCKISKSYIVQALMSCLSLKMKVSTSLLLVATFMSMLYARPWCY
jgi:hypothetical protein